MRVAIVSSPRSENTWTRATIKGALQLDEIVVDRPDQIPSRLPRNCILQLHWPREPGFQNILAREGFRVVTVARHPLDVLLSVLHFSRRDRDIGNWLDGACELPGLLPIVSPASREFRRWALGKGAENLLSVTYGWWNDPDALRLRYEDVVAAPEVGFRDAIKRLEAEPFWLEGFLAGFGFDYWRATWNRHGWQGRPGLWRELIPIGLAQTFRRRHSRLLATLGYRVPPHWLSRRSAEHNWHQLKV